jgi:hypothetical protein
VLDRCRRLEEPSCRSHARSWPEALMGCPKAYPRKCERSWTLPTPARFVSAELCAHLIQFDAEGFSARWTAAVGRRSSSARPCPYLPVISNSCNASSDVTVLVD